MNLAKTQSQIADFMGLDKVPGGYYANGKVYKPEELKYYSSEAWLVPVLEKIGSHYDEIHIKRTEEGWSIEIYIFEDGKQVTSVFCGSPFFKDAAFSVIKSYLEYKEELRHARIH